MGGRGRGGVEGMGVVWCAVWCVWCAVLWGGGGVGRLVCGMGYGGGRGDEGMRVGVGWGMDGWMDGHVVTERGK
jgi:hypothetical protein